MKLLVFLLVLANLLFYAFSTGLLGSSGGDESTRVGQQLHPERIRIVGNGAAPAAAAEPAATEEPTPASEPAAPVEDQACLRWTALSRVEAERVGRVVGSTFQAFSVIQNSTAEGGGWWVHIPPLASREAADKKARELKAMGVSDYFVVQEGALRNAISLGIFSTEKAAQDHLAGLQPKGVRSARVGMRPDKEGNLQLELRGPAKDKEALLAALAEALPKNPPKDCQ